MGNNLISAHGSIMVSSWMVFGSTGILFARYGRMLRFGNQRQFLGKAIWFQVHRFALSVSSLSILVAFFLILVFARGQWVNPYLMSQRIFAHSVLGGMIVCSVIVQVWLALYRCHPRSRFRFVFDWSHRITGLFSFGLSFPTMWLTIIGLPKYHLGFVIILSLWTGWIIVVIILFELIECKRRTSALLTAGNNRVGDVNQENVSTVPPPNVEAGTNAIVDNQRLNRLKLCLLLFHIFVSLTLSIPLIILICS